MSHLPDAAAAVVDHGASAEARAKRAAVLARFNVAVAAQERAKDARLAAADHTAELLRCAVRGEAVPEAAIIEAHVASRAAADVAAFRGAVAGELRAVLTQADAVFQAAETEAHKPIIEWAATVRIAAAAALDRAKADAARAEKTHINTPPRLRDDAALTTARAALIVATEAMKSVCAMTFDGLHYAEISKGVKLPRQLASLPAWNVTTETVERSYWNRPAPEPEAEPASVVAAE